MDLFLRSCWVTMSNRHKLQVPNKGSRETFPTNPTPYFLHAEYSFWKLRQKAEKDHTESAFKSACSSNPTRASGRDHEMTHRHARWDPAGRGSREDLQVHVWEGHCWERVPVTPMTHWRPTYSTGNEIWWRTECDHGSGWVMTNTDSLSRSLLLESLKRSHNKKLKIKLFKE